MKMLFLSVCLCAFVIWRMILPLKVKWYVKVLLALPLFAGAFKFQIFRVIGGHYFAPDLPEWIIMTGALLYGGFYFIPPLLGASEVLRFFKWRKNQTLWNFVNLGIICAALLLSGTALVLGAAAPVVTPYTLEHPQLPDGADGMKIAYITDLHIDHTFSAEKVKKLTSQVNALNADLIALGGDLMDGSVAKCGKAVGALDGLKAPLGVWGVPGNHEFYSEWESWLGFFRKSKIKLLVNESVTLPNGVILAGTGDKAARSFFRNSPDLARKYGDDVKGTLEKIPREKFVLHLSHRPKTAEEAREFGADLQLSGHTHGGMIRGFDLLVAAFNGGWVSGRYQTGGLTLLVSNGTWLWRGFPMRLGRPGEILLVTLRKKVK